jgi:hypothetical protein
MLLCLTITLSPPLPPMHFALLPLLPKQLTHWRHDCQTAHSCQVTAAITAGLLRQLLHVLLTELCCYLWPAQHCLEEAVPLLFSWQGHLYAAAEAAQQGRVAVLQGASSSSNNSSMFQCDVTAFTLFWFQGAAKQLQEYHLVPCTAATRIAGPAGSKHNNTSLLCT